MMGLASFFKSKFSPRPSGRRIQGEVLIELISLFFYSCALKNSLAYGLFMKSVWYKRHHQVLHLHFCSINKNDGACRVVFGDLWSSKQLQRLRSSLFP